jgi:hypothetical protein
VSQSIPEKITAWNDEGNSTQRGDDIEDMGDCEEIGLLGEDNSSVTVKPQNSDRRHKKSVKKLVFKANESNAERSSASQVVNKDPPAVTSSIVNIGNRSITGVPVPK